MALCATAWPSSTPPVSCVMLSRGVQVSYYGDADFATEDVMLVHDVNMADDPTVDVTAMLHSLPVEVQTLFSKLRKTWMEKVRARVCT
jgi:hypothetical protein